MTYSEKESITFKMKVLPPPPHYVSNFWPYALVNTSHIYGTLFFFKFTFPFSDFYPLFNSCFDLICFFCAKFPLLVSPSEERDLGDVKFSLV